MSEFGESVPLFLARPTERFSERAQDYARYRPGYPRAAIDAILSGFEDQAGLVIADVGAGTGIAARLLAARGMRVQAIEPNGAMRSSAAAHPLVEFVAGTAERTGLASQSVAVVTCFQAFHWFNQAEALQEFRRILQPGGRVAVVWNDRDVSDPFTQAYTEVVRKASDRDIFDRPDRKSARALEESSLFVDFRHVFVRQAYPLDLQGLVGLVSSSSYVPKVGQAYEELLVDLQRLYRQWSGRSSGNSPQDGKIDRVELIYQTQVYLARLY